MWEFKLINWKNRSVVLFIDRIHILFTTLVTRGNLGNYYLVFLKNYVMLSLGQTITTFQRSISQHCEAKHIASSIIFIGCQFSHIMMMMLMMMIWLAFGHPVETCCDILGVGGLHLVILFLTFEILSLFMWRIRYELNYCGRQ